ncbi:hypothetical protein GCM10027059_25230 [Myceligenerans halotolerans]
MGFWEPGPLVRAAEEAAATKQWPAVEKVVLDAAPAERRFGIGALAALDGVEDVLEPEYASVPSSLLAACLAWRNIEKGWTARSTARAKDVSARQFRAFFEFLRRAEGVAFESHLRDPADVNVGEARIVCARALQMGADETLRRYDLLAEHAPEGTDLLNAQELVLETLSPWWAGSRSHVDEFTDRCLAVAPPGTPSAGLDVLRVARHFRAPLYEDASDREAARYLTAPEVRDRLVAAAAVSVLHPGFPDGPSRTHLHHELAVLLSLGGHHAAARPHFEALGETEPATGSLLAVGGRTYARYRKAAMRAAGEGTR